VGNLMTRSPRIGSPGLSPHSLRTRTRCVILSDQPIKGEKELLDVSRGSECALPWFADLQEVRSSGVPPDPEIDLNVSPPEADEKLTKEPEKVYPGHSDGPSPRMRGEPT
jgi:hypothetical protein